MRFFTEYKIVWVMLVLIAVSCAKKGMPAGGPKDLDAPKVVMSSPNNKTINFDKKEIKIFFNEYITLKDLDKQLVISPPQKNKPSISPMSGVSKKYITVAINDTLKPNTTYSFNFGKSIVDATEANAYPNLKYTFSTGSFIDSLQIGGVVKDALLKKTDPAVSAFLYEVDADFTDSVIYTKSPRYVGVTSDSLNTFSLENIKAGKYLLIGVKDVGENYKFDPLRDKIGFHPQHITIPTAENFKLNLFKETPAFKANKPTQSAGNQLLIGYKGKANGVKIELKNGAEIIPSTTTYFPKKDSLQIWFKPTKLDSINVKVSRNTYMKEFYVKLKEKKQDSLSINATPSGTLHFRETVALNFTTPLLNHDVQKMILKNQDSTKIAFKTVYNSNDKKLDVLFDKTPATKYVLHILPDAIEDWFGNKNSKPLKLAFETKEYADYGNLKVNILSAKRFPILVELTNDKGEILATTSITKSQSVEFNALQPNIYQLRATYDDNANGVWDTGNFLEKIQPEEVIYFPKPIDVRVNWDIDQNFDLSK